VGDGSLSEWLKAESRKPPSQIILEGDLVALRCDWAPSRLNAVWQMQRRRTELADELIEELNRMVAEDPDESVRDAAYSLLYSRRQLTMIASDTWCLDPKRDAGTVLFALHPLQFTILLSKERVELLRRLVKEHPERAVRGRAHRILERCGKLEEPV
jgi:hypothetical protein